MSDTYNDYTIITITITIVIIIIIIILIEINHKACKSLHLFL